MFCLYCGVQIPDESAFCYKCGKIIQINIETKNNDVGSQKITLLPNGDNVDIFSRAYDECGIIIEEGLYFEDKLLKFTYTGNYPNGICDITWEDNDLIKTYKGNVKDYLPNGTGILIYSCGDKYEGQWKDGKQDGEGTHTWANGDKYEGQLKESKRDGEGIYTWANGGKYVGQWKDGKKNGYGIKTSGVSKYAGQWKDDKRHGEGTFTKNRDNRNEEKYTGQWKDDKEDGEGTWIGRNDRYYSKYVGQWKNGKRHGRGVATEGDPATETLEGYWINDDYVD